VTADPGSSKVLHSNDTRRRRTTTTRRGRGASVLIASVVLVSTLTGRPAFAHGDEGEMEVISAEAAGPLQIAVEVGVVYANDDDLAEEASITLTATGEDGTSVGPIEVPRRDDAVYAATFDVPVAGTWSLAITSTEPAAEAEAEVAVTEEAPSTSEVTTTEAPATSGPTESTDGTDASAPDTSSAPGEDGDGEDEDAAAAADDEDDGGSLLPFIVIAVVAIAAIAALLIAGQRRQGSRQAAE
jgi:hypothetical protein